MADDHGFPELPPYTRGDLMRAAAEVIVTQVTSPLRADIVRAIEALGRLTDLPPDMVAVAACNHVWEEWRRVNGAPRIKGFRRWSHRQGSSRKS